MNEDNLKETKDLVNAQSPDVQVLTRLMDVRDRKQVAETLDYFASEFGRIDIAVNNAGISDSGKMSHETSDEEIEKVFSVNLMGVYRCQIEELRIMMGQEDLGPRLGRGCIVNVSSMYGIVAPGPNFPHTAYATAKHGKNTHSRTFELHTM